MSDFLEGSADLDTGSDAGAYEGASDDFFGDLGDAFMDQVDSVDLGEDGSIEMKVRGSDPEPAAPESADSQSSADNSGEPASGQPSRDAEFLEGQYKEVQGWATKVSQENAELKAQIAALSARMDQPSTPSAEDDGVESDMDPDVQSQLDAYMSKNLGEVLSTKLGVPVDQVGELLREAQINRELRAAYAKYEDFDTYMPVMQEISKKYPDLDFDQLYGLATTFYQADASGSEGHNGSVDAPGTPPPQGTTQSPAPQPQPQPSQEDPAARARQVATLQSASNDEGFAPGRTISTVRDAALQALEDLGG